MNRQFLGYAALAIVVAMLPFVGVYPIFAMKVMCYALFACAFNLLLGFTGLLSFGHAAFLGSAAYAAGHALRYGACPPSWACCSAWAWPPCWAWRWARWPFAAAASTSP